MKSLCVFDLDGTLIPYDSFGRIVRPILAQRPSLLIQAVLRRLGFISRSQFAERSHRAFRQSTPNTEDLDAIARKIVGDVPLERRRLIDSWRQRDGHLVLLSASPDDYVQLVGRHLGFDATFGSHWENNQYRHLHGDAKRRFIDERFPATEWERTFAIADQESDEPLLKEFREVQRIKAW
jgi:HAD superfamily phosphoserine phosphatase-like hydrolase